MGTRRGAQAAGIPGRVQSSRTHPPATITGKKKVRATTKPRDHRAFLRVRKGSPEVS
jgi:hypothetical protein